MFIFRILELVSSLSIITKEKALHQSLLNSVLLSKKKIFFCYGLSVIAAHFQTLTIFLCSAIHMTLRHPIRIVTVSSLLNAIGLV